MPDRRWAVQLGVWVLAGSFGCGGGGEAPGAAVVTAGAAPDGQPAAAAIAASRWPVVSLGDLSAEKAGPTDGPRNPFGFQAAGAGPGARPGGGAVPSAPSVTDGAPRAVPSTGAAGPGSIQLKFIGTLDAESLGRVAVLSDGQFVFHGRTGEVIEGRYRIVRIGVESIELETVDGTRRQTIRLTGS